MNIQISNQPCAIKYPLHLIPPILYPLKESSSVCLSNILLYILLNIPTIKNYIELLNLKLEPLLLLQNVYKQNFSNGFNEKLNLFNIQDFFNQFSNEILKIVSTFSNQNTFEEYLNDYSQVWVLQGKGKFIDFAEEYIIVENYVYELYAIGKRVNKKNTILGKVNGNWLLIQKKKETRVENWKKCYKKMMTRDEIEIYFIYSFSTISKENAQNEINSKKLPLSADKNENTKLLKKIKGFSVNNTDNIFIQPARKRRGKITSGALNGMIKNKILVDSEYIWYCKFCQYPNDYDETRCELCKVGK
ncbi:hypothetical protein SteCoe_34983 [Stentor coeruleus]|uniref:RanBP2-type domain-containing protein n=1 Tax=Stentor coeruleus TaxID=5963 RepID=A0A1R2ATD4_9CILI|nr:hypothetical protein SteCoe_34983 [Stentor coeruleus]